ncbi:MAG: PAN domain-containing protein [Pseudomonadota bacterium]
MGAQYAGGGDEAMRLSGQAERVRIAAMDGAERIFINYRRADTRWAASRLYDGLSQRLGEDRLFMDVDSIPPGADFVEYLNSYVDRSKAIIVLIGPHWLSLADDDGQRRIDDPDDFVNIEISRALVRGITVIPVLVDGAAMPAEAELPDALKGLSRRQAVKLGHETYGQDLERLARALGAPEKTPEKSGSRGWLVLSGVAVIAVVAVAAIVLMQTGETGDETGAGSETSKTTVTGNWTSDFGNMIWSGTGATYGTDNGRLTGAFDGQTYSGHWVEDASEQPCATLRDGSSAWGRIEFTFDPEFKSFEGTWSYCGAAPDSRWAGARAVAVERAFTSYEENIDRPGGDYTSLRLGSAEATACQKLCSEDQRCLAWTYVAPGYQEADAVCWLKNTVPQGTRKDICCTSGVAYYRRPAN